MKQFVILFAFLCCAFFAYVACKRELNVVNSTLPKNEDLALIIQAQTFFSSYVRNQPLPVQYSSGNFDAVRNLDKSPRWDLAYVVKLTNLKAVIVPLGFDNTHFAQSSLANSKLPINNVIKLLIYKNSSGQFQAEVLSGLPDANFIFHQRGGFTGIALVQDWAGNFLQGYQYKANGENYLLAPPPAQGTVNTTEAEVPVTTVCNYIDWYSCTDQCTYLYTQDLGCTQEITAGVESTSSTLNVSDYATIEATPSPPTPIPSMVDTIGNSLRTPCFSSVFQSQENAGLKNDLTNIFINTFTSSVDINLYIGEMPTLPGNADAQTHILVKNADLIAITITLNDAALKNASKEFIAETIFHESIHAYLDANTTIYTEMQQHCTMIESYLDCELSALQEVFPTLSSHDGLCMIIGGMEDIQEYDSDTLNQILMHYNLTLTDVINTNQQYKSGTLGTTCGNSAPSE